MHPFERPGLQHLHEGHYLAYLLQEKERQDRQYAECPIKGAAQESGRRVTTAWKISQAWLQQKHGKSQEECLQEKAIIKYAQYLNVCKETHSSEEELG